MIHFSFNFYPYLNPPQSFIRVPIPLVCEFELNYVKIPKIRVTGSSGTGTTWIGTGTNYVLVSGTGTTLDGTGTNWPLHGGYRYHPVLVPVPLRGIAQKWQILPI